jgi:hypothetical protein
MPGKWRRYHTRWRVATRERLDLQLLELMRAGGALPARNRHRQNTLFRFRQTQANRAPAPTRDGRADCLGIRDRCLCSGDGAVLDAVDIRFRVIVVRDAVCSSSDEGHDLLMRLYHSIYAADRDRRRGDNPRAAGMTSDRASRRSRPTCTPS